VLYGGFARGARRRGDPENEREYQGVIEMIRIGWVKHNPAFRRVFTSRFVPGASETQMEWFVELCTRTMSADHAARLLEVRADIDVTEILAEVRCPTLVIHACNDEAVPLAEGRLMASTIPGAQFVELDSRNHILLEDEPAWARFQERVLEFIGVAADKGEDRAFAALTAREREVLALIARGLGNADIAESLAISDKTVRNHVSNLFDKLGVWTRAQAIVFARDRGFRA